MEHVNWKGEIIMLGPDKTTLIAKLSMLNRYLEEDKERMEKDIAYWQEQVEKFGEYKTIISITYGEALNRRKLQLEVCVKEIKENHRLIASLWDEINEVEVV